METRCKRVLVSTFGILVFVTLTFAQRVGYKLTRQQENRMFFFSSSAPMTEAINDITPSVVQHYQVIVEYISFLEDRVLSALGDRNQLQSDQRGRLCYNRHRLFNASIHRNFGIRGLPDPDRSCITDVQVDSDGFAKHAPYDLDQLYNAMNNRGNLLNANMKAIASRFVDVANNFTGAETPHSFTYSTHRVNCVLHAACGVRVGANWRIATPIHNRNKYENVQDYRRQVINEYARPVNGKLGDNILLRLPVYRTDDLPRRIREDATTYIVSWPRSAHPNCFRRVEIWDNPAIVDALDKSDHFMQQAEDALTPSSIAILALPLGLNLVPAALIADVSTLAMVLYLLFSDVLTCVPLLIKGIELILIRRYPNRAFTVRLTSASNGTRSESAGAEVWTAECRAPKNIGQAGTIFVALAIFFMIAGVVGEILASWYMRRTRKVARFAQHRKGDVADITDKNANGCEKGQLITSSMQCDEDEDGTTSSTAPKSECKNV